MDREFFAKGDPVPSRDTNSAAGDESDFSEKPQLNTD
jgi:hypothetical protein